VGTIPRDDANSGTEEAPRLALPGKSTACVSRRRQDHPRTCVQPRTTWAGPSPVPFCHRRPVCRPWRPPVLIESHEGHPTKVEGKSHNIRPVSGSRHSSPQAANPEPLYDPDRGPGLQCPRGKSPRLGEISTSRPWKGEPVDRPPPPRKPSRARGSGFPSGDHSPRPASGEQMALIKQTNRRRSGHQWDPGHAVKCRPAPPRKKGAGHARRRHHPRQGRCRRATPRLGFS